MSGVAPAFNWTVAQQPTHAQHTRLIRLVYVGARVAQNVYNLLEATRRGDAQRGLAQLLGRRP
jgi:hypothetical protein